MRKTLTLILMLGLAAHSANAQESTEKYLVVRHFKPRNQYAFLVGNLITVSTRQGLRHSGIITSISDSSVVVNGVPVRIEQISKIRQPSGNNPYAMVIGGLFILTGVIYIAASTQDVSTTTSSSGTQDVSSQLATTGVISLAMGIPLLIKPGFKVGQNCQIEIAEKITASAGR